MSMGRSNHCRYSVGEDASILGRHGPVVARGRVILEDGPPALRAGTESTLIFVVSGYKFILEL